MTASALSETVSRSRYDRMKAARQQAERLLEEKSRELYDVQKARSQALSIISHEVKTPLNGMLGAAQGLTDIIPGEERAKLDTVLTCGATLHSLIESLLTLAQVDAGNLELANDRFDISHNLNNLVMAMTPMAEQKGLELHHSFESACGNEVMGDPKGFRQVMGELITNAIKFTPSGRVEVNVLIDAKTMTLSVEDSGPGIASYERERVFDRYVQGEAFDHRRTSGAGIGLSLVRDLIQLRGGVVEVGDSELGGAQMTVRLPVQLPCEEQVPQTVKPVSLEGRRVLIVDDNMINRLVAQTAVSAGKMVAEMAENGQEALEALGRKSFDVVLMDIQMPVMTGDEAIRRIRASNEAYKDIPIIVITAHKIGRESNPFAEIGANHTMEKPVAFDSLMRRISNVMQHAA